MQNGQKDGFEKGMLYMRYEDSLTASMLTIQHFASLLEIHLFRRSVRLLREQFEMKQRNPLLEVRQRLGNFNYLAKYMQMQTVF
jgi:hypothetical protein